MVFEYLRMVTLTFDTVTTKSIGMLPWIDVWTMFDEEGWSRRSQVIYWKQFQHI